MREVDTMEEHVIGSNDKRSYLGHDGLKATATALRAQVDTEKWGDSICKREADSDRESAAMES